MNRKVQKYPQCQLISSNSPEKDRPFRPWNNHRLVCNRQRLLENVEQHNAEGDDDEEIGWARKRHEELQRADLAHQQDWNHDDEDVRANSHVPVEDIVADIVERVGDEDDVDASRRKVGGHERVINDDFSRASESLRPRRAIFEDFLSRLGKCQHGRSRNSADFMWCWHLESECEWFVSNRAWNAWNVCWFSKCKWFRRECAER